MTLSSPSSPSRSTRPVGHPLSPPNLVLLSSLSPSLPPHPPLSFSRSRSLLFPPLTFSLSLFSLSLSLSLVQNLSSWTRQLTPPAPYPPPPPSNRRRWPLRFLQRVREWLGGHLRRVHQRRRLRLPLRKPWPAVPAGPASESTSPLPCPGFGMGEGGARGQAARSVNSHARALRPPVP